MSLVIFIDSTSSEMDMTKECLSRYLNHLHALNGSGWMCAYAVAKASSNSFGKRRQKGIIFGYADKYKILFPLAYIIISKQNNIALAGGIVWF